MRISSSYPSVALAPSAAAGQSQPTVVNTAVAAPVDRWIVDSVRTKAVKTPQSTSLNPPAGLFKDVFSTPVTHTPAPRTAEDYQAIFSWVEQVTGKPVAYQNERSQAAYVASIQGDDQEKYDTTGFLKTLGVYGAETYGRNDAGVHELLTTIDYKPHSEEVSKTLQAAQKTAFWFFKRFPNTFNKVANLADKYYFTRKDTKAQSWVNDAVPAKGIPNTAVLPAAQIKAHYKDNLLSRHASQKIAMQSQDYFDRYFKTNVPSELGALFEDDFHMGVPAEGETPQNYGTYAIATQLGFTHEQAVRFGTANFDMDLNVTDYGDTDAFPNARPSRHFNLNKFEPEKGDTRFIWAQRHLDAAVELAKRGDFAQAEREIGYGLHSIQDAFAHGHIRLASHAITDNIPDGVDYNPVGAYEATLATIGYLKRYMDTLQDL
jgi:hypothetical protein